MPWDYSDKVLKLFMDAVVIEANGRGYFWLRELCSYQESSNGIPSYS